MLIAAAQTVPKRGDIQGNLNDHYRLIGLASKHKVSLIAFPELSLTGYEREKAESFSFTMNDSKLVELQKLAVSKNIIIIAGAPIKIDSHLYIGSFILYPNSSLQIYTKQFLHEGEEKYFARSSAFNPQIALEDELISLAICADINTLSHPENACKAKSTIYLASIFYTRNGIDDGCAKLRGYAKQYALHILMSNYGGPSWDLDSGGKSSFLTNTSEVEVSLGFKGEGLIIAKKENGKWTSEAIEIK